MTIPNLIILTFEPADLVELLALERHSVHRREQRSPEKFLFATSSLGELIIVAVLDGNIVGYIAYSMPEPPFKLNIGLYRILVNKETRQRGIGQALLNEVLAISAQQQYDWIESNGVPVNDNACRQFLLKNGFVDAGALSHQYDYLSMSRGKRA